MEKILHDFYLYLIHKKDKYNIRFIEYVTEDEINPIEGIHIIEKVSGLEQDIEKEYLIGKVK